MTLSNLIGAAFGGQADKLFQATTRRRTKLWEIPSSRHCALIGTCLPVAEMRKIAARIGYQVKDMSDYGLHTLVVGSCDARSEMAEVIQRYFDKRYIAAVTRFAKVRDIESLGQAWQDALKRGDDVAGALWAAWTHSALDESTSTRIFGDIHMLSHQVGAEARADLKQLVAAKSEAKSLQVENEALRRSLNAAQHAHDKVLAQLHKDLAAAEQRAAHFERRELELAAAASNARQFKAIQQRAMALAERAETLEVRNAANARRAASLELELMDAREELAVAEQTLEAAFGVGSCEGGSGSAGCGGACPPGTRLEGRCVLCIGGRTGMVDAYRRAVELHGGRFLHHDGGEEESMHRLDTVVASADAVVCQAACVSHQAYWRLKESCKKLSKPCVFVQSTGFSSFVRSLSAFSSNAQDDPRFKRLTVS